jgi:cell pole-organizing protein PopZ
MSDTGSRSESDAVLASIRRILVTDQDHRGTAGDDAAASEPLILTEALRVDADAPMSTDATRADTEETPTARDPQGGGVTNARAAQTPPPQDLPDRPATSTLDDTVVDEEFLRDIVSEIVREELQGELGERITRNVRKLVRREIHRAMASRDFD